MTNGWMKGRMVGAADSLGLEMYQALLERATDLVAVLDPGGVFLYVSPSHQRLLGFAPSSLVGTNAFGLVHPEDLPMIETAFAEVLETDGRPITVEYRHQHADSSWRHIEATVSNRLADPSTCGFVVNSRDITDRIEAEHDRDAYLSRLLEAPSRLHAQELETTLEVIADAIMIYGTNGEIVKANRAARALFNMDADPSFRTLSIRARAQHITLRDADNNPLPDSDIPVARALRGETLTGENAADITFTSFRGREVEINVTATPIRDESDQITGAVCVYRDVTHRRALERSVLVERDRLRTVLEELRTLEAKRDEFLSSLSHDLKNPLTGLRGMAQLLHRQIMRGAFTPETGIRHLESMIETTGTMTRMVENLVRVSRQEVGRPLTLERAPTDLLALTRSFVTGQQPVVDQDIIVECDLPEVIASVDADQFERVISNLVWNAIKYSSRRSRVWIHLAVEEDTAVLSVRDEGIGIPADELPHIFERFYRARNADPGVPGTGIGLVSVREIVQAHGGTIEVDSVEGQGSTFTVRLPLNSFS